MTLPHWRIRAAYALAAVAFCALACAAVGAEDRVVREGVFEVHYAAGTEALATKAARILAAALREFAPRLPSGEAPIRVYICASHAEFARYAGTYARSNVGGVAQPSERLIAIKVPALVPQGFDLEGGLRHELVHVLLAANVNEDSLPRWLNEGLAMRLAKEHRWGSDFRVALMYLHGTLIPYRDLTFAFMTPGNEGEFGDAYAEALALTDFLFDRVGEEATWQILGDLNTLTFAQALRKHANVSPAALWEEWRSSLWSIALIASIVSGFTVFQGMALLVVMAYLRKRRAGRETLRRWEEEEREEEEHPLMFARELENIDPDKPWAEEEEEEEER